ncbi:endonuclease/exonuclease/phosphatase family protein [Riemerella columbipharyngis]|uniref:Endonuclease/Exonuclease/phosphatase family protein n=1 Tax=Riemerella columbipharyngis TaxID=1071918 RepID=A0A1G7AXS6_9FLAO|nr:endonuclease [Riemerella columbipharyngis]SDE19593.1 Endonuclease/Exonuclease/phosphatase family protein [Riemerella columbipharyngis]
MNYISFYNTENFFPPDTPFLPFWDEKKYLRKRENIAYVFGLMKQWYGALPMLIGLAEVGNKKVVKELLDCPIFEGNYGYIHYESPDERGIDVALAYDKNRVKVLASGPIRFEFEMNEGADVYIDTTRDVLYAKLEIFGTKIHYFLVHLPSKREKDVNLEKRNSILSEIKEHIVSLIMDRGEAVIINGDFNENPNEVNIQEFRFYEGLVQVLENPFLRLYYERCFSTYHQKEGLLFDQIMCSQHFYKPDFPLHYHRAEVFRPGEITRKDAPNLPSRTYAGTRYLGGYSDHFPALLFFDERL